MSKINLPQIQLIRDNLEDEVKVFSSFLYHPYYVQNKMAIFRSFPELGIKIRKLSKKGRRDVIRRFIIDFYEHNREAIKKIVDQGEMLIKEKGGSALKELANLMNYNWPEGVAYKAIPTILPFSPFGDDNDFNFSILGILQSGQDHSSILITAVHEISHFILFDVLGGIKKERGIVRMAEDLKNYFKETLTAVLLNQKLLLGIFGIEKYRGNPEIYGLSIKKQNGEILSFSQFIADQYSRIKVKGGHNFRVFLMETIEILQQLEREFSERRRIWNEHGIETFKDVRLLAEYSKPMEIKEAGNNFVPAGLGK